MSSIHLHPVALESCRPNSLRERRRSSIRPLTLFPRFSPGSNNAHTREDSAIEDESTETSTSTATKDAHAVPFTPISPLANVHLTGYSTNIDSTRHQDTLPHLSYALDSSPTSPISPNVSSKNSVIELPPLMTRSSPERLKLRLVAAYFMYFMCGWGDGVTGTVIPYFEHDFHLTSLTSSLLFAGSTIGFASATVLVESITRILSTFHPSSKNRSFFPALPWLSRSSLKNDIGHSPTQGRYFAIAYFSLLHASFFVLMGTKGGYPILLLAYAFAAFARGIITAQMNLYFSQGPSTSIGYAYALWSFGGVVSPLICQTVVAKGVPWPRFYYGSLVLSAINTSFLAYAFRPTLREFAADQEKALYMISDTPVKESQSSMPSPVETSEQHAAPVQTAAPTNTLRLAFKLPYQWAVSIFSWLYCGSETTTQGFMVSYLLAVRAAKPATVGYVTSGFWGGITVGRLLWGRYGSKLSFAHRKYVVLTLLVIALVMQLLIWFVNSNVENAFSASVIGAVYGPIFPACLELANDLLPSEVHMVSMGLISAFASFGASLFPFITGTVATIKGMQSLSYMTVAQGVALVGLWYLFPSQASRQRLTI